MEPKEKKKSENILRLHNELQYQKEVFQVAKIHTKNGNDVNFSK